MTSSENLVTQKEISAANSSKSFSSSHRVDQEFIEDLCVTYFLIKNLRLEESIHLEKSFYTERNVALMQFCLHGDCNYKHHTVKNSISFKSSEYNTIYIQKGDFRLASGTEHAELLQIYIEEEFFFKQIPGHYYKNGRSFGAIFSKNLIVNPKVKNLLSEIQSCEFEGHLKTLYLKAKVIELITIQLADVEAEKRGGLKLVEVEKMAEIKELIESSLNESYSLAHLARIAGTNEQYLKKHFKALYGTTVFGYILFCKMQKAKDLLLTGEYRIAEIAEIVGYRHATHFTTAFKKFFGYLPKMLKTKCLLGGYFSLNFEVELLEMLIAF